MQDYSIWSLDYALFEGYPCFWKKTQKGADGTYTVRHSLTYIEGNGHKIMVDAGWSPQNAPAFFFPPKEFLTQVGVSPEDIDTVLLTHAHRDHASNIAAFPSARFYLQDRELFECLRLLAKSDRYAALNVPNDPETFVQLIKIATEKRLELLEGDIQDLLPGIDAFTAFDTHSPGHQIFRIRNTVMDDKCWVCAGDLVMDYANLEGDNGNGRYVPSANGGPDLRKLFATYDKIMNMTHNDAHRVLAPHVENTFAFFPHREWQPNLYIVEIQLAQGVESRL